MRYAYFIVLLFLTISLHGTDKHKDTVTPNTADTDIEIGTPLPESAKASRYLFLQQLNDICFMAPMYNCKRLETLLEKYPLPEDPDASAKTLLSWLKTIPHAGLETEWYTRRQWFGIADAYTYPWHVAMNPNKLEGTDNPALAKYFKDAAKKAPMQPHYYTAEGTNYFPGKYDGNYSRGPFVDLPALIKIFMAPYCFVDTQAIWQEPWGDLKLFENLDNIYRPTVGIINKVPIGPVAKFKNWIHQTAEKPPEPADVNTWYTFDQKEKVFLSCTKQNPLSFGRKQLGCDILKTAPETNFGYTIIPTADNPVDKSYSPYLMGLYKFILLRLGRDAAHNQIDPSPAEITDVKAPKAAEAKWPEVATHQQLGIHRELKTISNRDREHNLWSDDYLSEENFLPCTIATIFKENRPLFEEAQKVIDFTIIKRWKNYANFLKDTEHAGRKARIFKDKHSTPYIQQDVLEYLPGPEQALAYMIMNTLRLLWYGTLSRQAFYEYSNPEFGGGADKRSEKMQAFITKFFTGMSWTYENFVQQAGIGHEDDEQDSFIKVWHRILDAVRERSTRKYWVSFEGHGWVLILDQRLINLQKAIMRQRKLPNLEHKLMVLDAIHCVGIESSHSADINSFYKC